MFNEYFKKELNKLQKDGKTFAKENPLLAPALSESSNDPDLDRLLEGTAFLTADINRKIDDEFPEIVQSLLQIVSPQYIRPVPSVTIMEFKPKGTISDGLKIPAGTYIDSAPVNDTSCRFRTCTDVEVTDLKLTAAELKEISADGISVDQIEVVLSFELNGLDLSKIASDHIRIYLSDEYETASSLYHFLLTTVTGILIRPENSHQPLKLAKNLLKPAGFEKEESLVPYPSNILPAFRILQEYFLFPEKFLYLDLSIKDWKDSISGQRFEVSFICSVPSTTVPSITKDSFKLHTVSAVNLYDIDADPFVLNQRQAELIVKPAEMRPGSYQVFSVNSVYGLERGGDKKREFSSFTSFEANENQHPIYHAVLRDSAHGKDLACYLSIAYPTGTPISDREVVSVNLTCTNSDLPSVLRKGDIHHPTTNSPELVEFKNITKPTKNILPPLEGDRLWRFLSHLSSNYLTYRDIDRFKTLLKHYIFSEGKDSPREVANNKRINGIVSIAAHPGERIIDRRLYRGQQLTIEIKSDHFACLGDMYLFGSVLDYFLGTTASFNTYVGLTLEDIVKQETIKWPIRLGTKALI